MRNKRYTLAVRQRVAGEILSDVLSEILELLDGLDLRVKAVYPDRGFYNIVEIRNNYSHLGLKVDQEPYQSRLSARRVNQKTGC